MIKKALLFMLLFQNFVYNAASGVSEDIKEEMVEQAMLKLGDDGYMNLENRLKNLETIIHQQQTQIEELKFDVTLTKKDLADAKKKIQKLELEKEQHHSEEEKMAETSANTPSSEKIANMKVHRIEKIDTAARDIQNKRLVNNQTGVKDNTEPNRELIASNKMTEDNRTLKKRQTQQHIAFTAFLSHSVEKSAGSYPIILDQIITNDGFAYNSLTGVFTAPETGTYLFTFHIHSLNGRTVVKLVRYGERIVDAITGESAAFSGISGSNTAILHVTKGTTLWLETYAGDGGLNSGFNWRYVTFSGVLLY